MDLDDKIDKLKEGLDVNLFISIHKDFLNQKLFQLSNERLEILYNFALKNSPQDFSFHQNFISFVPGYLSQNYKDENLNSALLNQLESELKLKNNKSYKYINIALKTNLKSINNELSNKIMKLIINEINKNDKETKNIFYLLNSILLLKELIVDKDLKEDYENSILNILKIKKDFIKEKKKNGEDYKEEPFVSFSNFLYILDLIKKKSVNEIEFGKNIIDLISISNHFSKYIQIKFNKEIYNTIEKKYINKPIYLEILKILLKNYRFSIDFFKKIIKSIGDKTIIKFLSNEAIINSNFPVSIELFQLLLKDKTIIKRVPENFINTEFCLKQLNEDNRAIKPYIFEAIENPLLEIINNSSSGVFKYLQLYSQTFNNIISSKLSIESQLYKFFKNVSITGTPIRYTFLKSIIHQLIMILNVNQIITFLLPLFPNDCNDSIIFKLKLQSFPFVIPSIDNSINNNNNNNNCTLLLPSSSLSSSSLNITEIIKTINEFNYKKLPFYLIKDIIKILIEDSNTSQWCKLQVSLVSWKFFEICRSIMNNSVTRPIEIFDNFEYNCIEEEDRFSLLLPSCKYLKIKSFNESSYDSYRETSLVNYDESNLYHFNFPTMSIDSKYSNKILKNFLNYSLEILELNLIEPSPYLLKFFISSQKRDDPTNSKKLILTLTTGSLFENFELLLNLNFEIHLIFLFKNYIPELDFLYLFKENTLQGEHSLILKDKIKSMMVSIGMFFFEEFQSIQFPSHLILLIEEWDPNHESSGTDPLDEFLISKKFKNPNFNNILKLEIQFNTDSFDLKKILSIFQCAKSLSSLIIILNITQIGNDNNYFIQDFLNQIFNILSFKQFSNIKYLKIKNNFGYPIFENNLIPNNNIFYSFNFIDFFKSDEQKPKENTTPEDEESNEIQNSFETNNSFSYDGDYEFSDNDIDNFSNNEED
ncbi:hypothetical protein DDB_G0292856 [Dictyostelium discoideum AX4]|uniref:Uncharacterized protein n=1 Tax=Dictyostelium discoideum TaxID=44689 RepID=Q54CM3_DICDI|nr:hypothetical protein DDB_G0292856 [Dictyostelium discoideum AX4]EAL60977.1 hypothetical protein DDB_G0292856 [Dictyostelium discoideum AX4]|eukprot:XP_629393.1 hypothetical protein DDB_G0292856 [Dictyostelium discoideum AX4]